MRQAKTKAALLPAAAHAQQRDPRFAALARLLARHAARQAFAENLPHKEELIASPGSGNEEDSAAGKKP